MRMRALSLLSALLLTCASMAAVAQDELQYQRRAQRYEGIKPKPVSGYDLELVSVRIEHQEAVSALGDRLAARFFLPKVNAAHLIVRELQYSTYYWLDKVEPGAPWKTGFNEFAWPTKDVLRQLSGLKLSNLGVVVRLDKTQPSGEEHVAPALLYQAQFPERAGSYVFAFRLRDDANITSTISGAQGVLDKQRFPRQSGGSVLSIRWNAEAAPAGDYSLVLRGYLLDTNDPIDQTVRFYHQPKLR